MNSLTPCVWKMIRSDEAIKLIDYALELDPENAYTWYNKGVSYNNLRMYKEAKDCFKKAREVKFTIVRNQSLTPLFYSIPGQHMS